MSVSEEKKHLDWVVYFLVEQLTEAQIRNKRKPETYVGCTNDRISRIRRHNSPRNQTKKTAGRRWNMAAVTSSFGTGPKHLPDGTLNPAARHSLSFEFHVQRYRKVPKFRPRQHPRSRPLHLRFRDALAVAQTPKFAKHNIQLHPFQPYIHLLPAG